MFDPLAFLKPDKAFSLEGLLSRDMFEKFDAEDEQALGGETFDDEILEDEAGFEEADSDYYGYPSRLHLIASTIEDQYERIVELLNQKCVIGIGVTPSLLSAVIVGNGDVESKRFYRVDINDGPPLSNSEVRSLAQLIAENIKASLNGLLAVRLSAGEVNAEQMNVFITPLTLRVERVP